MLYYDVSLLHDLSVSLFIQSAKARNDAAFFARTVRRLMVAITLANSSDADAILGLCTHILSLHIIGNSEDIHYPEIPELRHFHSLTSLSLSEPLTFTVDRLPPHITHVRLCRVSPWMAHDAVYLRDILRSRPSVTHLLYSPGPFLRPLHCDYTVALQFLKNLRKEPCPRLRVFVVLGGRTTEVKLRESRRLDDNSLEKYATSLREIYSRTVVVNTDWVFFGKVKHVLEMDFEDDDIWDKAEEYLLEHGDADVGLTDS